MKKKYTSSDIEVLKGIEPVQKRPGMYTDTTNPNHLVQELIDNSVDEAISGHCDEITIHLHNDHSITVEDNGRGMPVDPHPKHKDFRSRGYYDKPTFRSKVFRKKL